MKTCFGCCPLGHGVGVVAIFNLLWNLVELILHCIYRDIQYGRTTSMYITHGKRNYTLSTEHNVTPMYNDDYDYSNWSEFREVPVLSGVFMDYLLVVMFSWVFMEIVANICLKQSTFKHTPYKIYVWLVTYYANLAFMITYMLFFMSFTTKELNQTENSINTMMKFRIIKRLFAKSLYIAIICFEIFIVHSYYIMEKKAMLNDFVRLKWKYVSRGKVETKNIEYVSVSAFKAETSRQTRSGSTMPPYITNIVQNSS